MFISLMFRSSYVGVLLIIAERLSDNLSLMPLGVVLGGSICPHQYPLLKAPVPEHEMFLFSRPGFFMVGVGSLTPPTRVTMSMQREYLNTCTDSPISSRRHCPAGRVGNNRDADNLSFHDPSRIMAGLPTAHLQEP